MRKANKAVFLDRDGTIIKDKGYMNRVSDIEFYKNAFDALRIMQYKGYMLIALSNQSGIARGLITLKQVESINKKVIKNLKKEGVNLRKIYYCPHISDNKCYCRKPNTGMLDKAARDFGIDIKKSYVIGDKLTDVMLGINAGAVPILLLTGRGRQESAKLAVNKDIVNSLPSQKSHETASSFPVAKNLLRAAMMIKG